MDLLRLSIFILIAPLAHADLNCQLQNSTPKIVSGTMRLIQKSVPDCTDDPQGELSKLEAQLTDKMNELGYTATPSKSVDWMAQINQRAGDYDQFLKKQELKLENQKNDCVLQDKLRSGKFDLKNCLNISLEFAKKIGAARERYLKFIDSGWSFYIQARMEDKGLSHKMACLMKKQNLLKDYLDLAMSPEQFLSPEIVISIQSTILDSFSNRKEVEAYRKQKIAETCENYKNNVGNYYAFASAALSRNCD